jgi:cytidyltransferase-like protein
MSEAENAVPEVSADVRGALQHYVWPGNVTELRDVVKHAKLHAVNGAIVRQSLPPEMLRTLTVSEHVGVVPTMGALHAGHLELARTARKTCDRTIVTIFVNPTQFAPTEDLGAYPRTLEADLGACGDHGADAAFVPDADEMYPTDAMTEVHVRTISETVGEDTAPLFEKLGTTVGPAGRAPLPPIGPRK